MVLGLSDLAVIAIAFQFAYFIRQGLPGFPLFFLSTGIAIGLLFSSLVIWWVVGVAVGVYRRVETYDPLAIIKTTVRQALLEIGRAHV